MELIHLLGQILFGGYFIMNGLSHFSRSKEMIGYAGSMKVPNPSLAVYGSGFLLLLGGIGIVFNMYVLWSLILLVVFLVPVTFTMHPFWKVNDPMMRMNSKINFMKNIALLGAVLMMMY